MCIHDATAVILLSGLGFASGVGAQAMRVIKSFSLVALAGIVAAGLTITSARAALIELDLPTVGEKAITLDDVTGLEWLDLTVTRGRSYNDAATSGFATLHGFRHASISDVAKLFTNAGIVDQSGTAHVDDFYPVIELLNKFGCTGNCPVSSPPFGPGSVSTLPYGLGWAADLGTGTLTIARPEYQLHDGFATAKVGANRFDGDLAYFAVGNWMIRGVDLTAVPEPATLAIFTLGLLCLGVVRRRKAT